MSTLSIEWGHFVDHVDPLSIVSVGQRIFVDLVDRPEIQVTDGSAQERTEERTGPHRTALGAHKSAHGAHGAHRPFWLVAGLAGHDRSSPSKGEVL